MLQRLPSQVNYVSSRRTWLGALLTQNRWQPTCNSPQVSIELRIIYNSTTSSIGTPSFSPALQPRHAKLRYASETQNQE
jgi:hypothetical protein